MEIRFLLLNLLSDLDFKPGLCGARNFEHIETICCGSWRSWKRRGTRWPACTFSMQSSSFFCIFPFEVLACDRRCGSNNEKLLNYEFYIGLRQRTATGRDAELLHEFICVVKQNYVEKVLIQVRNDMCGPCRACCIIHSYFLVLRSFRILRAPFMGKGWGSWVVSSRKDGWHISRGCIEHACRSYKAHSNQHMQFLIFMFQYGS